MNQKKDKVIILLSTYNGAKYVADQINSILNQTFPNIELYIRDDGSTDDTCIILKKYENNNNIHIEYGNNLGFIKSFLWLVKNSGEADYYAFSDQDDIWFPKKIDMAIEKFKEYGTKSTPTLYFSNYDFYDSDLNYISRNTAAKIKPSFQNSLVDCMPLGFNSVFNRKACEIVKSNIPQNACGHDWWLYMICVGMGEVLYDPRPTCKYRRHNDNVSAGGMSFIKFQIWRFEKFFKNNYFANIRQQWREYEQLYGSKLSNENRKILNLFTREKYSFPIAVRKAFHRGKYRQRFMDEIIVRFLFIIGKI